jgi:hypothetical protein
MGSGSEAASDNVIILQARGAAVLQRSFSVLLLLLASSTIATEASGAETTICGGIPEAIDTSVSGEPFANLELSGRRGFFLIDTGGTDSLVDMQRYGRSVATKVSLSGFSLPSVRDGIFTAADLRSFSNPGGGELGVVGTDLLSRLSIEFHYEQSHPFAAFAEKACDEAILQRADFVGVGLKGYYHAEWSQLKPGMPNVPVIGLRIGQITFPAQVDTGLGDVPKGTVQVNAAVMRTLRAAGIKMHPVPNDVVTLTCSGRTNFERRQTEHQELAVVTPGGKIVATYPPPLLELKSDNGCGGISRYAEPFAQIGASWLSRWGTSVFQGSGYGVSSTVWIASTR